MSLTIHEDSKKKFTQVKLLRKNNSKNFILGHLNINSLRNKFDTAKEFISSNFDLILLSETKLDAKKFPKQSVSD